jgi:hypothetical protein
MPNAPPKPAKTLDPRPEAGVFSRDDLTDAQKVALDNAHSLMATIAGVPFEKPGPSKGVELFLPRLGPPRDNHVVLFDGARGSGKTSVMLSLFDTWANRWRANERDPDPPIVPAGLIDLQPLPPASSLMLHLAGPFERIVEAIEEPTAGVDHRRDSRGEGAGGPPWQPWDSQELPSRLEWRRFVRAMAGWERGFDPRRNTLDPEAYAMELEQAERERLDLRTRFASFLDALVVDFQRWRGLSRPPLFVLALDDADMNPARAVELMDLVRTLWHPRLGFLVTGDSNLFLVTLREHFLGTLRKPTGPLALTARERDLLGDLGLPARLATDVYDKAMCAQQRLALAELAPGERTTFQPKASDKAKTRRTIHGSLAGITVKTKLSEWSGLPQEAGEASIVAPLARYFDDDPQVRLALPGNLRKLENLHAYLQPLVGAGGDAAVRVAMHLWDEALKDSDLLPGQVHQLRQAVRHDLEPSPFVVHGELFEVVPQGLREVPRAFQEEGRSFEFTFGYLTSYAFRLKEGPVMLPDTVGAALMLATDVAADLRGGFFAEDGPAAQHETAAFFAHVTFAQDNIEDVSLNWPVPRWGSFLDFALLSRTLKTLMTEVESPRDAQKKIVFYAQAFIDAVAQIALSRTAPDKNRLETLAKEPSTKWEALAREVVKLAGLDRPKDRPLTRRERKNQEWARASAGLLGSPAMGLPAAACRQWLTALEAEFGAAKWPQMVQHLRRGREELLNEKLGEEKAADFRARVSQMTPKQPWFEIVGDESPSSSPPAATA